jgi:hypothetical protein
MLEIDKAIVDRVKNDATIQTIMGGTATDRRIYAWYPTGDIIYTEGRVEVAIIYRVAVEGYAWRWSYPSQFADMQLFMRVLSISQLKLGQTAERLIDLFDKGSLQTTNWSVRWIQIVSMVEGMNEGEGTKPIHTRNVSFMLQTILRRN